MQTSAVLSLDIEKSGIKLVLPWRLAEGVRGQVEAQAGIEIVIDAAAFLDEVDAAGDASFAGGEESRRFFRDEIVLVGVENGLIESHPAERRACFNDLVEVAMLAFAERDCFFGPQIVAQNFCEQLRPPPSFGREPLADDVAQRVGETNAQLLFFAERKQAENTVDRLAGIDRVQRAQNKVTGFGGHERDFDRRAIAHFADENDLRRLAQARRASRLDNC